MLIDLHLHEKTHSSDSILSLAELTERAQEVGLDGVCITDHESIGLMEYAQEYAAEINYPIFVGVEYLTKQGDILAYGINKMPKPFLNAQDFIDFVNAEGGACIAAHPFRNNNRGLGKHLLEVDGLTGIEILNGNSTIAENRIALEYCNKLNLQAVGGSDSHDKTQVGKYATEFPDTIANINQLVQFLKYDKCQAAILRGYDRVNSF